GTLGKTLATIRKYFPRSAGSARTRIMALRSASQRHSALRAVAASRQRQVARRLCLALFESPDFARGQSAPSQDTNDSKPLDVIDHNFARDWFFSPHARRLPRV